MFYFTNTDVFYLNNINLFLAFFACGSLHFQVWIGDAGMVDGLESLRKYQLGEGDVTEGDRTLLEESPSSSTSTTLAHQSADAFFRIFLERA